MAQLAHAGLLAARDVSGGAGDLVDNELFPYGGIFFNSGGVDGLAEEIFFGVYIDDLCAISLIPWLRAGISPSVGNKVALAADSVHAAEGWPQSIKRAQNDLSDTNMGGHRPGRQQGHCVCQS